jgi:hypothetical protein
MSRITKKVYPLIFLLLIFAGLYVGIASAGKASYRWTPGQDSETGISYDWDWYRDEDETVLINYYYCLHVLTGWNMPLIDFVGKVSPEDLATMPQEMYDHFMDTRESLFKDGKKTLNGNQGTWLNDCDEHIWTSPEGYVYNGDRPPFQYLVSIGWEEYADRLPPAPAGAPFPAPSYSGTPKNTLPLAKINLQERERVYDAYSNELMTIEEYYELIVPCPNAIYINPRYFGDWDWTEEMKVHLANLGLDTDMGKTRIGYEKSGTTIVMVGMTLSGTMKEWTLKLSKGAWACDSADAEDLEDMLFILEKIDAISSNSLAAPVSTVTAKDSLTSLKSMSLKKLSMNVPIGVNSSALQKNSLFSGKPTTELISDRGELLSQSGTAMQQKSLASTKAVRFSPKTPRVARSR